MATKRKVISQREARKLKRRVEDLECMIQRQRSTYVASYPGGVHLGVITSMMDDNTMAGVYTAQRLGHAVVATADGAHKFNLYAIPHPEMPA